MNLNEVLFLISFLGVLFLSGIKLYNMFSLGKFYSIGMAFVYFSLYIISWVVLLIVTLLDPTTLIYSVLLKLSTWLLVMQIVFLAAEIFLFWKKLSLDNNGFYNPNNNGD